MLFEDFKDSGITKKGLNFISNTNITSTNLYLEVLSSHKDISHLC